MLDVKILLRTERQAFREQTEIVYHANYIFVVYSLYSDVRILFMYLYF